MINFPENTPLMRQIASHYAAQLDKPLLQDFLANNLSITCPAQALIVCNQFQQLIDLAMLDNSNPALLNGISNVENVLFSLFNLVYEAMLTLGFEEQWQQASDRARLESS